MKISRMNNSRKKKFGFSLIELMIVVAIVAIIAAFAFPSYRNYVIRSKRAAAAADLTQLAHIMEREFTATGRYDDAANPGDLRITLPYTTSPQEDPIASYDLTVTGLSSTAYTLNAAAAATGGQGDDAACGTLSTDETGDQCILGGTKCRSSATSADAAAAAACW